MIATAFALYLTRKRGPVNPKKSDELLLSRKGKT